MAIEIQRRRPPSDHIVTDTALGLIKGFEGLHLAAYPDPASELARTGKGLGDPWTIGWGRTKGVKRGDRCTLDQANAWLREDVEEAAQIVRNSITVPLTAGEFAALTSMAYNFGYLPKSLKACLNGGVTDKGVVMEPGSYGAALLQFPRNCRAKGKPMKGLYRRRLAEATVFSDLPFENACSPTVVRFELDENGEIDANATTSLEDTLMRARQDTSRKADIMKKPWSELVLTKAEPVVPTTPGKAEPLEVAPPKPPPPAVSAPPTALPSGPVAQAPAVVVPAPQPPPSPVAAPKPPEPVIIAPKTVDVKSIPYGEISPDNGAKNMSDSQRGVGMVIVGAGSLIQIVTARLGVGTAVGAILFDASRDPVVIALVATGVVAVIGWLMRKRGTKVMTTGMVNATQVLK